MKNTKIRLYRNALLLIAIAISFSGCVEEYGGVGEPFDRVSSLSGTWNLVQVVQVDEDAVNKGFPEYVQRLDITDRFAYPEYTVTLLTDENGSPTSFTEEAGNAPSLMGNSSGTWSIDHPDHPSKLIFSDGSSTAEYQIGTYNGIDEGTLLLKFTRFTLDSKGNEKPFVSYNYTFEKE